MTIDIPWRMVGSQKVGMEVMDQHAMALSDQRVINHGGKLKDVFAVAGLDMKYGIYRHSGKIGL